MTVAIMERIHLQKLRPKMVELSVVVINPKFYFMPLSNYVQFFSNQFQLLG